MRWLCAHHDVDTELPHKELEELGVGYSLIIGAQGVRVVRDVGDVHEALRSDGATALVRTGVSCEVGFKQDVRAHLGDLLVAVRKVLEEELGGGLNGLIVGALPVVLAGDSELASVLMYGGDLAPEQEGPVSGLFGCLCFRHLCRVFVVGEGGTEGDRGEPVKVLALVGFPQVGVEMTIRSKDRETVRVHSCADVNVAFHESLGGENGGRIFGLGSVGDGIFLCGELIGSFLLFVFIFIKFGHHCVCAGRALTCVLWAWQWGRASNVDSLGAFR